MISTRLHFTRVNSWLPLGCKRSDTKGACSTEPFPLRFNTYTTDHSKPAFENRLTIYHNSDCVQDSEQPIGASGVAAAPGVLLRCGVASAGTPDRSGHTYPGLLLLLVEDLHRGKCVVKVVVGDGCEYSHLIAVDIRCRNPEFTI
ncbi:hypothetical protein CBL_10382 [Carabus blaptoides fortunei]